MFRSAGNNYTDAIAQRLEHFRREGRGGQARAGGRRQLGRSRARPRGRLPRAVARGPAHLRLLRVDGGIRADRQDRAVGGLRQAGRHRRLPRLVLGRAGRAARTVPAHRARRGSVSPTRIRSRVGPLLAVAVGLGLRRRETSPHDQDQSRPALDQAGAPSGLSVAGINLGLLFGGPGPSCSSSRWGLLVDAVDPGMADCAREISDNQKELERLKPIIAEGQRYRREKQELERRVNAIEMVARNQARPVYLLDALIDMLPADLWLTRVEEKGQQLRTRRARRTRPWRWRTSWPTSRHPANSRTWTWSNRQAGPEQITAHDHLRGVVPVRDLSHGVPRSHHERAESQKIVVGVIGLVVVGGSGLFLPRLAEDRSSVTPCGTRTRDCGRRSARPRADEANLRPFRAQAEACASASRLRRSGCPRRRRCPRCTARSRTLAFQSGLAMAGLHPEDSRGAGGLLRRADRGDVPRAPTISSASSSLAWVEMPRIVDWRLAARSASTGPRGTIRAEVTLETYHVPAGGAPTAPSRTRPGRPGARVPDETGSEDPMSSMRRMSAVVAAGLLTAGCGGSPDAAGSTGPRSAVADSREAPKSLQSRHRWCGRRSRRRARPLPPIAYEPKGRRDPFTPISVGKEKPASSVSAVKLTGIVKGRGGCWPWSRPGWDRLHPQARRRIR